MSTADVSNTWKRSSMKGGDMVGTRRWILVGTLFIGIFTLDSSLVPVANAEIYYACKNNKDGTMYMVTSGTACKRGETKISWNDMTNYYTKAEVDALLGSIPTPPLPHYNRVAAGAEHVCALRSDGTVICWGKNDIGESTPPSAFFTQLTAGDHETCGLTTLGLVQCWGGRAGQLLYGIFTEIDLSGYQSYYLCGLMDDSSVVCMASYYGPPRYNIPPGKFTQVSAGYMQACGVKTNGTLDCWEPVLDNAPPTPVPAPSGTFTQVSVGYKHSCGVKSDGSVTCWGEDVFGETIPPAGTFAKVKAGGGLTCGIKTDSTLACWGNGDYGATAPPPGSFTEVTVGKNSITDYASFACGLRSDGQIKCWGNNTYGQCNPPPFLE